jgi:hypothetical protein
LVNYVDTWRNRPEAVTRIPNIFLASDYVRTFTDLATMEAANEAARRAVNGVIQAARADVASCEVWNLHEPEVFLPFRAYDRTRYRRGQAWDGEAIWLARSLFERSPAAAQPYPGHTAGVDETVPTASGAEAAATGARTSSDQGLRRLRVVQSS